MHLWIVTIGSSDVQLDSDKASHEKGRTERQRSDKIWNYWYTDELKAACYDVNFVPQTAFRDKDETYRIASRILGMVYNSSSEQVQQEIWSYLTFPLLDNFVQALATYPAPEAIAVLLTDQSVIFSDDHQRRKTKSPYWQDTCELKPILQSYFASKFPDIACEWLILQTETQDQGLDNWNAVLDSVRKEFRDLEIAGQTINLASEDNVYVSHQAGTPAISSAVQFCSLEKFGDHVKFLVSNEYNQNLTRILLSSNYLIALKRQQAEKLLERHDYSAVKEVFSSYLSDEENILLDAAIQWNYAKFDNFADELEKLSDQKFQNLVQEVKEREQHWWWEAYEAAYLGVVRLKQGNTVEAMFHSFRAVEGLLYKWVVRYHSEKLEDKSNGGKDIVVSRGKDRKPKKTYKAYGKGLYWFLSTCKTISERKNEDIWVFGNSVFDRRNELFHQLEGLHSKEAVFAEWQISDEQGWKDDEQGWKDRVKNCLNFIAKEDLTKEFKSLEEASLMVKVHQELEKAIAEV